MATDDVDDGERDKEFGIRFDDRVSFYANEHDETAQFGFTSTYMKQGSRFQEAAPRILLKVPARRKVGSQASWPGFRLAKSPIFL